MTIDEHTGRITLPEIGVVISPGLTRADFLQVPAFSRARISVRNEPWCSYNVSGVPQTDTELYIVFRFHGDRLHTLDLSHNAPRFGTSWADWSEERELARKVFHEQWLAKDLRIRAGKYPWGTISSCYDPKGGCSSIIIRYA